MATQIKTRKKKKTSDGSPPQAMPVFPPANARGNYPAAETLQVIIARQLIERRQKAGLTQSEVAKMAGIRQETVSRLESGKHAPTVRTVEKIDRVLRDAGA